MHSKASVERQEDDDDVEVHLNETPSQKVSATLKSHQKVPTSSNMYKVTGGSTKVNHYYRPDTKVMS